MLQIENQIANVILKEIEENNGVYIPKMIKQNKFIHFAADNVDFHEDTSDGKRTLHGTVITVYQVN